MALQIEDANIGPEKVHVLQTKHATYHTTYFDKQNGLWREDTSLLQAEADPKKFNANAEPEKVHDLIPEAYRTQSNDLNNYPGIRTAFYAQ